MAFVSHVTELNDLITITSRQFKTSRIKHNVKNFSLWFAIHVKTRQEKLSAE